MVMGKRVEKGKTAVIELNDVQYEYDAKTKVLEDIHLTMDQGDFLGLVGPNGSGKSTLIKLILGLLPHARGHIRLFGQDSRSFDQWNKIGYVSQKANSFNSGFPATVYEIVSTGLFGHMGLFRWIGRKEKEQIMEAIKVVGLESFSDRNIGRLSGGQQQRTFIARALVSHPQLLILDEPTVGVDAESVDRFFELLHDLNRMQDISILLISHDIGVITSKVSHVACLNKRLFFHGDPQAFMENQEEILARAYGHDVHLLEHVH